MTEAQFCKNKECQAELAGPDEGAFAEVGRYGGFCADCYDNWRSGDLEEQLDALARAEGPPLLFRFGLLWLEEQLDALARAEGGSDE